MKPFVGRYYGSFVIASLGALVLLDAVGKISGGDVSAFPQFIIGFIVFGVAAPTFIYYRSRIKLYDTHTLHEKDLETITSTAKEKNNGKK